MGRGLLAQATVHKKSMIAVAVSIILTGAPHMMQAAQITPNPNPAGSTIDIINDPFSVNNENPYSNGGTINIDSRSTLTNSVGATLNNYDLLGTGRFSTLTNAGTLNNVGTLSNFDGSTLTNSVGARLNNYGLLGNGGISTLTNDGRLNNFAGATLVTGFFSTLTNTGTLNNFAGASLSDSEGHVVNSVGGTLNNLGLLNTNSTILINDGTLNNFGSWRSGRGGVSTSVTNSVGARLNNYGLLDNDFVGLGRPGITLANAGTLNNVAGATLTGILNNTGTLTNAGTLNNYFALGNAGTLINTGLIAGLPFPVSGNYIQTAGQTINNGTLSQPSGVDIQGGSLRGTGTINAPVVTLSSGAILSPGDATTFGTLTINGNLQSSGNLMFRIGGLGAGQQFDVLAIHGMAFLNGGTVGFNFVNFTPVAGNSWDFLYAGAISGWDTLHFFFSSSSPDLAYAFNYSNGVETLRVVSVPEPSSLLLSVLGLGGLGLWRRLKGV